MSSVPSPFRRRIGDPLDTYALDVWDPLKDFSFFFPDSSSSGEASSIVNARVDWKETHVKEEEIKVEDEDEDGDDGVFQISNGERNMEGKEEKETWQREERGGGKLMSWFRMPEIAKMDRIKAVMECGVLTMTVPKAEVKKTDVKAIQISG